MLKVRVWDLPTRLFHWSLVFCFFGLILTGQAGGAAMVWHFRLGYCVLTLLLFRLVWGFVGGHWSRFNAFVVGPSKIWRYLQGHAEQSASVGHNPLGSLSVMALLGFALLQIVAGLFSDDEIATSGPFSKLASSRIVGYATFYHTQIGKPILIGLVLVHIAAMVYYRVKRKENLVLPMLNGDKHLLEPTVNAQDNAASRLRALTILVFCALFVTGLIQWADHSN